MNEICERSQVIDFYTDKTIFLTGGTGFLGKVALEKVLRTCRVKKVFLLVRQKKGKSEEERLQEICSVQLFDGVRKEQPDFKSKLELISGDCQHEDMGISETDWKRLQDEVDVVLHCAATVRFDQELRTAFQINVRAPRDLLMRCKDMKKLKSVILVSTAYSNCPRKEIDEICYKPPLTDKQLEGFLDAIEDNEMVANLVPKLLGEWPNTYTFTKIIAEEMLFRLAKEHGIPAVIFRPSIIISTYKEPMPGWVDNFYGPIGAIYGVSLGLVRTLNCSSDTKQDMVPADFVVNAMLTTAWATALEPRETKIYNYVANEHQTPNGIFLDYGVKEQDNCMSSKVIWYISFTFNPQKWKHNLYKFCLHTVPAHAVDTLAVLLGKKPRMVKIYDKIHKYLDVVIYFMSQEWKFHDNNMKSVWNRMNDVDKQHFEMRMSTFDWIPFMPKYLAGAREVLLKDPMSTLDVARKRYRKLVFYHWTLMTILALFFIYFVYLFYSMVF